MHSNEFDRYLLEGRLAGCGGLPGKSPVWVARGEDYLLGGLDWITNDRGIFLRCKKGKKTMCLWIVML